MANLNTKLIILAIVIALYATVQQSILQPCSKTCHESCSCTPEDGEEGYAFEVQCGEKNLTSVPITTCEATVSLLNLSYNGLETLKEDALSKYKSVKYLYLKYCKLRHINDNAFLDLENLTVVDLSENLLGSLSADLFSRNELLDKLILQSNNLFVFELNTTFLNGPDSLTVLDLQSCTISYIYQQTFSLIPNLKVLDISNNDLTVLDPNTLSSQQHLENVNLENNPWECGTEFKELVCWMYNNLAVFHNRTVNCRNKKNKWEVWPIKSWALLCGPITTPSHERDMNTSTTLNQSVSPSNKSDVSTNNTLKATTPSEITTPSHERDMNTSTLNQSVSPSNKSDVSTNNTLKPTTPSEKETDSGSALQTPVPLLLLPLFLFR